MSKSDNVTPLPEIGGLKSPDVGMIISLLAQYEGKIRIVKEEFKRQTKKKISDDVLNQIRSKYAERIQCEEVKLQEEGKLNPLARPAYRLKVLSLLLQDATEWRHRKWERINKDESDDWWGYDSKTAIECVDLAHKIDMDIRKHELDIWKAHQSAGAGGGTGGNVNPDGETMPEAVNDGVAW